MKKLKLSKNSFANRELLSRSQLKRITGGDVGSGGPCVDYGNVCSPIFEDVCCQFPGMGTVTCKGASGTQPGQCST